MQVQFPYIHSHRVVIYVVHMYLQVHIMYVSIEYMYLIIGVGAWCLVPHLHHSKVITHFVQERGGEIEWKHLHSANDHIYPHT